MHMRFYVIEHVPAGDTKHMEYKKMIIRIRGANKPLKILIDYIFNNQLTIDKGTYLTVVIGQITVYAILLTFYQFIISFQGTNSRSVMQYLGKNLIEYYVNEKLIIYNHIILNPLFPVLLLLEILYKPIISIWGDMIPNNIVVVANFIWYAYAVLFFILFVILFFRCTKCVLSIKNVIDIKKNRSIISSINEEFRKKILSYSLKKNSVDMLIGGMNYLKRAVESDNDSELLPKYHELLFEILYDYEANKEKELVLILKSGKAPDNQKAAQYDMNRECNCIRELLDEKYIPMNDLLEKYVIDLHFRLLKINLQRAFLKGDTQITIDKFYHSRTLVDCREWNKLTKEIYAKGELEKQKRITEALYAELYSDNELFRQYCEKVLFSLIKESIEDVFIKKKNQKDFVYVFKEHSCNSEIMSIE